MMNKLLHGIVLSGALLAVALPADASKSVQANNAAAARSQDKGSEHDAACDAGADPVGCELNLDTLADRHPPAPEPVYRTDDALQAVFDRNRPALNKIYLRELKKDPTLEGELTLRMTIAPDGHSYGCLVSSSTLQSPTLVHKLVEKVCSFNFGAVKGAPSIMIKYGPIEFHKPS